MINKFKERPSMIKQEKRGKMTRTLKAIGSDTAEKLLAAVLIMWLATFISILMPVWIVVGLIYTIYLIIRNAIRSIKG